MALRRLLQRSVQAEEFLRSDLVAAPTTIVLEVLNGLVTQVRFAGLPHKLAAVLFDDFRDFEIDLIPVDALAAETIELAGERQLSVYDASYVALAERLGFTLVTADRRLAATDERIELIP